MYNADALSRMQAENSNRMATVPEEEMNIYVDSVLESTSIGCEANGNQRSPR